ncbi:hypothetical protein EDD39_1875 [Kitasatospora cineracea]|uniref:Uncharacterized protein n=1 Tax=Kitasatospora cineracea TaxID=88074 RepID=A0A8G1UGU3_9ACTN|nr:hypothetical protein EDD39_1875 [Kitasatospora cineracea]
MGNPASPGPAAPGPGTAYVSLGGAPRARVPAPPMNPPIRQGRSHG